MIRQCRGGWTLPAALGCTAACLPLALSTGPALHPAGGWRRAAASLLPAASARAGRRAGPGLPVIRTRRRLGPGVTVAGEL